MSTHRQIKLSDHFTVKKLLLFTLPSIAMMIFTSIYGVVDGFFVSNYAGKTEFAAVNFIMPYLMILGTPGFMFGTGGSALVSITMGGGDRERANRIFSMLVAASSVIGVLISVLGIVTLRPVAALLGAEGKLLDDCVLYGIIILLSNPAFVLQMEFQSFFVTAEKPQAGLFFTLASGVANMILDALLVGVLDWGLVGAAAATGVSQCIGGLGPLLYFARPNSGLLRLTRFRTEGRVILKACTNGSSELASNLSMSLVGMLYNVQLLRFAGEDGVSAYGVLMYVNMIFIAAFIGYSIGTAPVVGFHYGAQNYDELRGLLRRGLCIIAVFAVCMFGAAILLRHPLALIFVGYDVSLTALTERAFSIFSFSFLFCGFAICGSGFFTALGDGLTSAVISFLRTLVFQVAAILLLPLAFGIDGIWSSIVVAEVMAVGVCAVFLFAKRSKYHYM